VLQLLLYSALVYCSSELCLLTTALAIDHVNSMV
jgi:hypothetical protein